MQRHRAHGRDVDQPLLAEACVPVGTPALAGSTLQSHLPTSREYAQQNQARTSHRVAKETRQTKCVFMTSMPWAGRITRVTRMGIVWLLRFWRNRGFSVSVCHADVHSVIPSLRLVLGSGRLCRWVKSSSKSS